MKNIIKNKEQEKWEDIQSYKGIYQISNYGRVRRLPTEVWNGYAHFKYEGKILKTTKNKNGYYTVCLCKQGKVKRKYIHRLVAETFIENPNNYQEVNHKDENKENNHMDNLEWCNRSYNNTYQGRAKKVGEKLKGKYTYGKNPAARKIYCKTTKEVFNCIKEAAEKYGIHSTSISHAIKGDTKSAGKFEGEKLEWEYWEE